MSVSAISSGSDPYSTAVQGAADQRRQELQALATALKSGDLTAAKRVVERRAPSAVVDRQSASSNQAPSGQRLESLASAPNRAT